ncbi:integrase domain-containing protein [Xenorhabdus khoisanae]|uniref:integrase domain-containing protein n=1 Tax=Xenorhabdus khoisanae TaxID=880157 RepID=UPI002359EF65|nr:integrase domain-containing protein [Xenorhabdus khoisanae]MDC9612892.1 integrase domain-containing protein [Xenorhabdus khoisanae]
MSQKTSRSKVESFKKDFITCARKAGGSFATVADRTRIAKQFLNYLSYSGIKLRQLDSLKVKYFEGYITQRKSENISNRTLQNEMSALRGILSQAGKHKLADPDNERLNNRSLGISGASRSGTKEALTPDEFKHSFREIEKIDKGVAATLQLAYVLGLRTKEAVQACKSVQTWKNSLNNGHHSVRVVFGTKGGRPRDTTILDREQLKYAIQYAENIMKEREGKLIDKPSIHQAVDRYRNIVRSVGLIGKKSPHSVRYHFAKELSKHYQEAGFNSKEVLAQVSMDLGHGDGRGRYINQVYYQNGNGNGNGNGDEE